jgi:hypothetical protein
MKKADILEMVKDTKALPERETVVHDRRKLNKAKSKTVTVTDT